MRLAMSTREVKHGLLAKVANKPKVYCRGYEDFTCYKSQFMLYVRTLQNTYRGKSRFDVVFLGEQNIAFGQRLYPKKVQIASLIHF
jgi:hypothetical protein